MDSDVQQRVNQMADILRKQGLRLTPQRLAILKVLVSNDTHPSAEQVFERVRQDFPTTSLATVYKTLAVLKETGQVTELGFCDDANRYDLATEPHAHLVCVSCKTILDPEVDSISQVSQQVAAKYGFKLLNQRMDFFGICPRCQASARAGSD